MAPIFATMTGLSEEELPSDTCPSGIYFLEVPGLCVGGSDVRAEGTGTIAYVPKDACNKDWDSAERRLFFKNITSGSSTLFCEAQLCVLCQSGIGRLSHTVACSRNASFTHDTTAIISRHSISEPKFIR